MKTFAFVAVCLLALAIPVAVLAGSDETGFDGVVRNIETKYHVHATRIPFMGLVSLVANRASQGGVSRMHVAEFDNFTVPVDGGGLNRMVEQKLGPEWERMVRETSKHGREQTLVFIHPEGKRMGMFVLDADGSELDVVQLSVDPQHFNQKIRSYQHHHDDSD
jgi:hypothetical protein